MGWFFAIALLVLLCIYFKYNNKSIGISTSNNIVQSILPEKFVVFDLETTGLQAQTHEIIEIGAIRVNRDADEHESFQLLIKPHKKIPKKITDMTGITQDMVDTDGTTLESAINQFRDFIGGLPLVAYNAEFDMGFLSAAISKVDATGKPISNRVSCALKMARRAWPGRNSYKLSALAKDGGLSDEGTHRALDDCKRTLIVYGAAAAVLRSPE